MYANGYDLVIEDHGCGISASDLKRIREKGFTGENGRVHKEESSGLGLYLCEQVLGRLHHPFRIGVDVERRGPGSFCGLIRRCWSVNDKTVRNAMDL